MLATVINSEKAVETSIRIIEIFVKIREFIAYHIDLKLDIDVIKKKLANHDKNIELVFNYLDELLEKQEIKVERLRIGFKK
jgi:hypothetical protein